MRRLAALLALTALVTGCGGGDRPVEFSLPDDAFWPDPSTYPGVGEGRILVTNNLSDSVSVLDLAALARGELVEIARVPVGLNPVEREGPHHLTVDPSGEFYYVGISNYVPAGGSGPHGAHGAGTADGHVLKIRAADNVQVGSARVDRNPGDVRMTPDGTKLLVSHFDTLRIAETIQAGGPPADMDSFLAVVDPTTMTVRRPLIRLCPAAHGIGIAPDSSRAYVSCIDDGLAIVDLVNLDAPPVRVPVLASPGTVEGPLCEPYAITVAPAGDSVWVSCFASGEILRYDTATGRMDGAIAVAPGGRAVFGAFSGDGATLYLPHQQPDGIAIVDVASRAVTGRIALPTGACVNPHVVKLTDDERWLIAVCEGNHAAPGTILLIDPATRALTSSLELGVFPDDVQVLR